MEGTSSVSKLVVLLLLNIGCCWYCCAGCLEEERRVLLQIKDSINHPNGSALPSWVGNDCCKWGRVECDETTSHVIAIDLERRRGANLGIWNPNLTLFSQFKQLQSIDLSWNQINGSEVLKAFCGMKLLEILRLDHNSLEGVIPECLGEMHSLRILELQRNYHLNGSIPLSFSNLTMLEELDLSYNSFAGEIAFSMFSNLTNLVSLDLSQNHQFEVETEFPTPAVPSFQVQVLRLEGCNLNKRSGSTIPSFISNQINLVQLDLSGNSLVGSIPSWMFYNVYSSLSLKHNMFNSQFPHLPQNLTSLLMALDLSDNHVYGALPTNIGVFFPNLNFLNLSTNHLDGSIPLSLGEILSLEALDLSNNHLSGAIPKTLTMNGNSLKFLSLSNNSLQGEMLPQDSNMTNLLYLRLDSNRFTGMIPSNLTNSPKLEYLDIRNNSLSGDVVTRLPVLHSIKALLLRGNQFKGQIPRKLCQMQNLQYLDLSYNSLSGSIPSCLNNITLWKNQPLASNVKPPDNLLSLLKGNGIRVTAAFTTKGIEYHYEGIPLYLMTGIDMSSNKLIGSIPVEMGHLIGLRSLNLSNNVLSGPLPSSFQNFKSIESLDLSHNKLNGSIPYKMSQLNSLSSFSVAFNNLSGEIPYTNQLSTFSKESFLGNSELCGQPLERNCSMSSTPQQQSKERARVVDSTLFFYSFVALSYVWGLCGFFFVLILNTNWRQIYFKMVDRCISPCF